MYLATFHQCWCASSSSTTSFYLTPHWLTGGSNTTNSWSGAKHCSKPQNSINSSKDPIVSIDQKLHVYCKEMRYDHFPITKLLNWKPKGKLSINFKSIHPFIQNPFIKNVWHLQLWLGILLGIYHRNLCITFETVLTRKMTASLFKLPWTKTANNDSSVSGSSRMISSYQHTLMSQSGWMVGCTKFLTLETVVHHLVSVV